MPIREFYDLQNNVLLARAELDESFQIGGMLNNQFQSDHVPFTWSVHAIDQARAISMFAISEEKYMDYRSAMLKQMVNMNPNAIKTSIRSYMEPEDYIRHFAESIFGSGLELEATAQSPSLYNVNLQAYANLLGSLAQTVANNEAAFGYPCNIENLTCRSYLFKYKGERASQEYTVLAAVDFEGFEMHYQSQMTGLFTAAPKNNTGKGSDVLGHGNGEIVEWGSKFRFLMVAPKQNEAEAGKAFLKFVNTFEMNPDLTAMFSNMINQKMQQQSMQTAQYQAQTQANIVGNMYQQQKLTNMLYQNSQSISNGIMDSWNQKMASDSRISNNFSEAIRGVNTYTTTDGRNVEVGVSADHVYQNQYGDVYGVSGNGIDNDILNKINWTEINKK